jgi:chromate transporter
VGLKSRGVLGAVASFVGFGLPAFLLMMALAALYAHTRDLPVVLSAFSGLQAIIVAVVANATVSFGRTTMKNWSALVIAGLAAVLFGLNVNPIYVVLLAALAGLAIMRPQQSAADQLVSSAVPHPYTRPLSLILSVTVGGFLLLFLFNRTLFDLALLMFRIDVLAFGGGFASVPLMLHEVVQVRDWLDGETFMNGIVLGQVTPGPIVITATFVGYLVSGPLGGVLATLSIFLPSFVVLVGVSPYFDRLRMSLSFNKVIGGVLSSFVGLLMTVTIRFALDVQWDVSHAFLASSALVALLLSVDILWVVLTGALASVVMFT